MVEEGVEVLVLQKVETRGVNKGKKSGADAGRGVRDVDKRHVVVDEADGFKELGEPVGGDAVAV